MKPFILKIIIVFLLTLWFWFWVYGFSLLTWSWNDTITANVNDTFTLDDSALGVKINLTSKFSPEYSSWKRFEIIQSDLTWSWFIVSEQYWDFYIVDPIELTKEDDAWDSCTNTEKVSYSFSGSLQSPRWWDIVIEPWSHYCPASKSFILDINSSVIWSISLTNTNSETTITGVTNTQNESKEIADSEIFNTNKVSVSGMSSSKDISWTISEVDFDYSDSANNKDFVNIDYWVTWKIANFNLIINKNIEKLTRSLAPITVNTSRLLWFTKELHYYDFSWDNSVSPSNEQNFWKILTIWTWWSWDNTYNKMRVSWTKTLIVKWWNIYINADIYNNSNQSLLVIVVKRDSNNKQNWGNIYIDPSVTNIDAVMIADGSILSYNWSDILSANQWDLWALQKQLLIYGSISTRNTIWDDDAPYNSDWYIENWEGEDLLYNLENLRAFEVVRSSDLVTSDTCFDNNWNTISSRNWYNFAFAWKKQCYIINQAQEWLRSTEKLSSLVIEYNPRITLSPPEILQKN